LRYSVAQFFGGAVTLRKSILLVSLPWLLSASMSSEVRKVPVSINGRIPLGIESFRLEPAKSDFYLMASAEQPDFIGLQRITEGEHDHLISGTGKPFNFYPERVQFRLTASARERLTEDKPYATKANESLPDLFLKLHFRLKIFHGLIYRYVQPSYIDDIGMPRDVPYDERIFRIGFNVGKVPIEDRIVMEVLSPTGERLCKFHLDLL
jgi:hypothetical protein